MLLPVKYNSLCSNAQKQFSFHHKTLLECGAFGKCLGLINHHSSINIITGKLKDTANDPVRDQRWILLLYSIYMSLKVKYL